MKLFKQIQDIYIYKLLFLVGICYLIIDIMVGFTTFGLWKDELFSVMMVNLPLNDMIAVGINDVHPLLYYFIYKFFVIIGSLFNYNDVIVIGRFVSILPFCLLAIFNYTKVSRVFGWKTAGVFNLLIFSMPLLMDYALELRMYGWALLFITVAFVYIKMILNDSNLKNWMILTICVVLAAYTHYFAAVGGFALYLTFLIYIFFKKKELLKTFILSTIVAVLVYVPWIPFMIHQITQIQGNYWIELTLKSVFIDVLVIFASVYGNYNSNLYFGMYIPLLFAFLLFCVFVIVLIKNRGNFDSFAGIGLVSVLLVPSIGIGISLFNTPIYYWRYIIPMLGVFWLSFSVLLCKIKNKKIVIPALIIILICGIVCAFGFINHQQTNYQETLNNYDGFKNSNISDNDIVVSSGLTFSELKSLYLSNCTHYSTNFIIGTGLHENGYFSNGTHYQITNNSTKNLKNLLNDKAIQEKIKNGSKVYYIEEVDGHDKLVKSGFNITDINVSGYNNGTFDYRIYLIKGMSHNSIS